MATPNVLTPTTNPAVLLPPAKLKAVAAAQQQQQQQQQKIHESIHLPRRKLLLISVPTASVILSRVSSPAFAASDDEYAKETAEVIDKVRHTINLDRNDSTVPDAVADLRACSNNWVAKYRKEKALLGRPSFREIYSALNAISGHYISFGPSAPIPNKRKLRILEEMETAEKALSRGR